MTESATLGQKLWQSSALGLGLINAQRQLIEVNDTFCAIYGYTRDELLEQPLEKLAPAHFRERARLSYQNYVSGNSERGLQYVQRKDGSQQYVQLTVEHIDSDNEEPLQLITVTALPAPERESAPRTILPASFSNVFLFECDRSGKCLMSNTAAQRHLGIRPQQQLQQQVAIYSGQIQRTLPLAELLKERTLWDGAEWQLNPESERPLWVLANTQLSDQQTTAVCLVSIDAQKRLEDTLTRNLHSLRTSNQHLERFLYGATHDLKAPLASLLGLIDIFRHEEDPEEQAMYLQLMEKSITRLNEFIHEIVDYSKNSNQSLRNSAIDFKSLVNDVFESLGYVTFASQIEKDVEIHQTAPFYSDAHRIKVILSNLISNAYKYSSVHRRPGMIRVSVFASQQEVTLQVRDNGLGIAKEHINKIFDMFYRASEQQSGSGLGLYIVKETIEKMKGTISVDSTLGEGTCFTVSLPASPISSEQQMHLNL
uniref:histidine kinase n=1 Tax=Roseihalotalea indica TaxID=2867963 RepID=A0AA49JK45_9BACT|nr:ATP-binding protein [Tunicatimonas sp. TK19036]